MSRLTLFFLYFFFLAGSAFAANGTDSYYHHAFVAIDAGKPDLAEALAARGSDPVLNKVLRGYAMALPGNNYNFNQLIAFISNNPGWPELKGIQMIAEQKISANASPAQVVAWFAKRPPITLVGFYRYIDALDQSGLSEEALTAVRKRWIEDDFSNNEQTAFYARFGSLLTNEDQWARTDRLLWKNNKNLVRRMLPYLSGSDRILAEARFALANEDNGVNGWLSRVPSSAQNDPGLLYQRLRHAVKNDDNDDAVEILLNAPSELGNPEAWWEQRHIMARRAIEERDYKLAYRLASNHGQTEPSSLVQAEFLSGWLALRFLDEPGVSLQHFQSLYDNASTPMSRARGAYWIGRAYEALDKKDEAERAYENAAVFNTTYYGQLALTRLHTMPVLIAKADPHPPEEICTAFSGQDIVRAIEHLAKIGEERRASAFFRAAVENTSKREDYILLTEVAGRIHRPDLSIEAVKAANQKNILVQNGGFPLISMHVPNPPEPALTHALIRQESMFNPDAESAAGARGLMQLMPRTAKGICKKIGVRYKERLLDEPAYNLQLGTAFAAEQIDRFDGSYILALAGYNAGPKHVREWIDQFGDPRSADVDPVDWIELIPIPETRNYVQRIIESMQVYRAKLAGGQARLLIIKDLKR